MNEWMIEWASWKHPWAHGNSSYYYSLIGSWVWRFHKWWCQRPWWRRGVPSLQAAVEARTHDYIDLHTRVITDPKTVLLSTNCPQANETSTFYHLSWIYQLQISILCRSSLWVARPASWWVRCWKQRNSVLKELIDTIPFQCRLKQDTDLDIDRCR